jgi:hypothetical protein
MTDLKITSAQEIRSKTQEIKGGELVKLPSGSVVKLTRPSLTEMLKKGLLPDHLISVALKQTGQTQTKLTAEDLKKGLQMIDFILMQAFVEPKLVEANPGDNEICLDDLTEEDRNFAYQYAQGGGSSDLKPFRSE